MKTKLIFGCIFAMICAPALYADTEGDEEETQETTETISIEEVSSTEYLFALDETEEAAEEINTEDVPATEYV